MEFDLDSDSGDDDEMLFNIDVEAIDEQTSAIHCLGNLSLNCSALMQPYLEQICEKFKVLANYMHENIRYHVCLSLTQIAFGQLRLALGKQDSDDKMDWTPGLPGQPLPPQVKQFLDTIVFPHFKARLLVEVHKEVVEKVMECVRDLAEEMGPASIADHMDWIVMTVESLLDKTSAC